MEEIVTLGEGTTVSLGYIHIHMLKFPVRVVVPETGEIHEIVAVSQGMGTIYALTPVGKPEQVEKK